MSLTSADAPVAGVAAGERVEVLFAELAELTGQRNAIDGQIVQIVTELDRDGLCGSTGARSVAALVAWKTGMSPNNAQTVATVAHRSAEFPTCVEDLRAGHLSLDQVGVIAERGGAGSDAHYAELAASATVTQLRTAIKLEPRPDPEPRPVQRSISRTASEDFTRWRITLPHDEAAMFDAALKSYNEKLVAEYTRNHTDTTAAGTSDADATSHADPTSEADVTSESDEADGVEGADQADQFEGAEGVGRATMPTLVDAFMALIQAGWDTDVAARPHGQHTTVIAHLDLDAGIAALHLGPILPDADRQYLLCDATFETWFERNGTPIGCGRTTRGISRRLRRALEFRDHGTCVVPGCGATRGLHAHHLRHWGHGGLTELDNLVLVCPYHHRLHHRGRLTLAGPATRLVVTDEDGRQLHSGSLARPPTTPPPAVPPYKGPTGERAQWWWYQPWEPPPQSTPN